MALRRALLMGKKNNQRFGITSMTGFLEGYRTSVWVVALRRERLVDSYKITSDIQTVHRKQFTVFPNTNRCHQHLKLSSKKLKTRKGKIPWE